MEFISKIFINSFLKEDKNTLSNALQHGGVLLAPLSYMAYQQQKRKAENEIKKCKTKKCKESWERAIKIGKTVAIGLGITGPIAGYVGGRYFKK